MGLLKYALIRHVILLPVFILSVLKGIFILASVLVVKGPRWLFLRKRRDTRPACMDDPSLGTHKMVKVKDLTLHVVESGDPKKPLMLFVHGYPECWYSWRHQVRHFNKDYHCVTFDMRGTGESDAPPGKHNYVMDKLTADVSELIRAVGHQTCILVAHDWGGLVAWEFAARYPDMVDTYIPMNIPHPDRYAEFAPTSIAQMRMSWYVYFYQLPCLPEMMMSMGDFSPIKMMCMKGPATEEDVEAFKFSISRPGRVTTFINYYRNLVGQIFQGTGLVKAPTLLIWGTNDLALHTQLSYETEKFCPKLTVHRIEGGDHFIQHEQPDLVNRIMEEYLKKK